MHVPTVDKIVRGRAATNVVRVVVVNAMAIAIQLVRGIVVQVAHLHAVLIVVQIAQAIVKLHVETFAVRKLLPLAPSGVL